MPARLSWYNASMSTVVLRQKIKDEIDRVPLKRLALLAEYVKFLNRPSVVERIAIAEKAIKAGKGIQWRKARSDV